MNSTSIVTKKIAILNRAKFDATSAIKEELTKSEKLRIDIAEKASEALNYTPYGSNYPDLVSLDVSASNLALQQRRIFKTKKKMSENFEQPDIMDFFSDDLEYESACLACDSESDSSLAEMDTQADEDVFRLHRLIDCWRC